MSASVGDVKWAQLKGVSVVDPMAGSEVAPNWPEEGSIEFVNVHMRYRPTANCALNGVNFKIKHGEKVGVVGRTGSGKSTLLLALYRMFELAEGRIMVSGTDITSLPLRRMRRGLSIIPQVRCSDTSQYYYSSPRKMDGL